MAPIGIQIVDGFEFQGLFTTGFNAGGTALYSNNAATAVETSVVRTGGASLKVTPGAAAAGRLSYAMPAGQRSIVVSFYIRFEAGTGFPASDANLFQITVTTASQQARVNYDSASGKLKLVNNNTLLGTTFGPALSTGVWYHVEVYFDTSATTYVLKARVNDDVSTEVSVGRSGLAAEDIALVTLGTAVATGPASTLYFDDVIVSNTLADYPLGPYTVEKLAPTSDGTHNGGTNVIEKNGGTDIGGGTTDAYTMVNEVPPENTDYIQQAGAGSGNYAEVVFANPSAASWGATYRCAIEGAGGGASDLLIRIVDSGGTTKVDQGGAGAVSGTTRRYSRGYVDGNVTGNKARIGFATDVTPVPRALTVIGEAAIPTRTDYTTAHTAGVVTIAGGTHVAKRNVPISHTAGVVTAAGGIHKLAATRAHTAGLVALGGGASPNRITRTHAAGVVTIAGGTHVAQRVVPIAHAAGVVTAAGGAHSVRLTRQHAAGVVTLAGGDQSVRKEKLVAHAAGVVALAGGTHALRSTRAETSGVVTLAGGTHVARRNVPIAHSAGLVAASGGSHVLRTVRAHTAAQVVISGGNHAISTTDITNIAQSAGVVTLAGGAHTLRTVRVHAAGVVALSGGTHIAVRSVPIAHTASSVALAGGTHKLTILRTHAAGVVALAGGDHTAEAEHTGTTDYAIVHEAGHVAVAGGSHAVTASSPSLGGGAAFRRRNPLGFAEHIPPRAPNRAFVPMVASGLSFGGGDHLVITDSTARHRAEEDLLLASLRS